MRPLRLASLTLIIIAFLIVLAPVVSRGSDAPKLGSSLRKLVEWHQAQPRAFSDDERRRSLEARFPQTVAALQTDAGAHVAVVDITLDGTALPDAVGAQLTALGASVIARYDATRGAGSILSARLPLDAAEAAARLPGVYSIALVRRAHRHIGKATSQGVAALDVTAAVQAAYDGTGITVGVISDSFNTAAKGALGNPLATHAADDIATGDLPGSGNPLGHLTPVAVLADGASTDTDEGRAMLQIVHDLAPGARLAFTTDGGTPETLAANIRQLRTNTTAPCDIIVDDLAFAEEPFFSDGPAAQAADEAVHSDDLAGRHVLFYSAAGDQGASGSYDATFAPVPDATARTGTVAGNLKLAQVPAELTASGFHNFSTRAGQISLSQTVTVEGDNVELDFQWDDPWVPRLVSTDYSLLVFDADGNYLADLSGTDDSIAMGRAIQIVDLPLGANRATATYQLAIAQRQAGLQQATHLRYLVTTQGALRVQGYSYSPVPSVYGHAAANGADAVAAFAYTDLQHSEGTGSTGPVTIYFDDFGNRLATPEVRDQPTMAAVDGVDTTFFPEGPLNGDEGTDTDNDGYPNFYGTSAATPHAAGVAALLLEAAGGKGKLTAAQMRGLLESTAASHDLDPGASNAAFSSADGQFNVSLAARGDASNNSAFDSQFFTVTFTGPAGSSLHKLIIDTGAEDEDFDESADNGYPFTVGLASGVNTTGMTAHLYPGIDNVTDARLVVKLPYGNFPSGGTLAFGIDRDDASADPPSGGNSADLLAGATIAAKFILADGTTEKASGKLVNKTGTGYSPDVGYGLINAEAALVKLKGQ